MALSHRLALRLECLAAPPVPPWVLSGAALDLDFVNSRYFTPTAMALPGLLSCSRAGAALAQKADGSFQSFAADVPRITDLGLLVEEARTNLILYSDDAANAAWTATDGTISPGQADLLGGMGAGSYAGNGSSGTHAVRFPASAAVVSGTTYTVGVFVKAGSCDRVQLALSTTRFSSTAYGNFYLNGAGSVSAAGGVTGSGIAALAGGWYFIWVAAVCTNSSTGTTGFLHLLSTGAESSSPTTSLGTNFLFFGAQTEAGAFPTSHITTAGSAVTRPADLVVLLNQAASAAVMARAALFETSGVRVNTGARLVEYAGGAFIFLQGTAQAVITDGAVFVTITTAALTGAVRTAYGFDGASMTARSGASVNGNSGNFAAKQFGTAYLRNAGGGGRALNGYLRRASFGPTKGQFDGLT